MKIKLQLKDIVRSDRACEILGLNPWCVNEGLGNEEWYTMTVEDARKCGLI